MGGLNMRYFWNVCLMSFIVLGVLGCDNEVSFSPPIQFQLNLNDNEFQNGDILSGKVVILTESLISGTEIMKIDCRLDNIVIGTVVDQIECPFEVKLKDKPIGTHTMSVIIKYQVPGYDLTYLREDYENVIIKE